eukprot:233652_1
MATRTRPIDALSVASNAGLDPLLNNYGKPKNKNRIKCIFVSILFLLLFIMILLLLYFFQIWPFNEESSRGMDGPPGIFGEYPLYGGNLKRQQISPHPVNITRENIFNLEIECSYLSPNGVSFDGYITIDDNNRAYFTDYSGFITCIQLDSCRAIWRKNIAGLLGYNTNTVKIVSRNSVTIYIDKGTGLKSVLFGTPNKRIHSIGYQADWPCYAISLDIRNGNLLWKINLGEGIESINCHSHGFIVDKNGDFAYGGLSSFGWQNMFYQDYDTNKFRGRMIKIDLITHKIIDKFYTLPSFEEGNEGYVGGGIWMFPAIMNDYLVFGTGDLTEYPQYISDCLYGEYDAVNINNSYHYNPCNEDVMNTSVWRCLEKNIYIDSLIVLNKTNFDLIISIPFQGIDAWTIFCDGFEPQNTAGCPSHPGPDGDLAIVSIYNDSNDPNIFYAAAHQKSGMFYVIEIPSGAVLISKKTGKWSTMGGANQFSLSIDEVNRIAITSITGYDDEIYYASQLADNNIVCEAGYVEAIDLNTGYTMYQIMNPYSKIGNQCHDIKYDEYIDHSFVNKSLCERSLNNSNMLKPNETCIQYEGQCVIYPNIDDTYVPLFSQDRAKFYGGITIANEMVFIPSITGDIFIHDIKTGEFIHRLECPMNQDGENNRPAIGGGVTVVNERVIFYCGRRIKFKVVGTSTFGNQVISMKLNSL